MSTTDEIVAQLRKLKAIDAEWIGPESIHAVCLADAIDRLEAQAKEIEKLKRGEYEQTNGECPHCQGKIVMDSEGNVMGFVQNACSNNVPSAARASTVGETGS